MGACVLSAQGTAPPSRGTTASPAGQAAAPAAANPGVILDTAKGTIEIELFQSEAPKSVEHIIALVKRGSFYRAQRFHRVEDSLVQAGDPLTKNFQYRDSWGTSGSGNPIGVAEISKRRQHVRGTVGLASAAGPAYADSQFYIMKRASPSLDGKYAIIGQVTKGMEVVDKIEVADLIKDMRMK